MPARISCLFFDYGGDAFAGRLRRCALPILFVCGAFFWLTFLHSGRLALNFKDWQTANNYCLVWKDALTTGAVPYHVSPPAALTDRFLANPEVNITPPLLLLRWMSPAAFLTADLLLLYAAGFAGCLLFARRYRLGLFPFAVLFLLFNFNGFIVAHISVGHTGWYAYFLLPLFLFPLLRLLEGDARRSNLLLAALALTAILAQGGVHMFVWCAMLLLLTGVFSPRYLRPALTVLAASGILSAYRLLPAAVAYRANRFPFAVGFTRFVDLFDAFTRVKYPSEGWQIWQWECNYFIGFIGFATLLYFGIHCRFGKAAALEAFRFPALDIPLLVLAVLSVGRLYEPVMKLPIPLAAVERVPARFLCLPLVVLVVLAAIRMQASRQALEASWVRLAAAAILLPLGAWALWEHSTHWSLALVESVYGEPSPFRLVIAHRSDPLYTMLVAAGWIVSLLALTAIVVMLLREARRPALPSIAAQA